MDSSADFSPTFNGGAPGNGAPQLASGPVQDILDSFIPAEVRKNPEQVALVAVGVLAYKHRGAIKRFLGKLFGKKGG